MPDIVVFGSLNADLVLKVPTLPAAGQTVLGGSVRTYNGGKGANQAVAAARSASLLTTAVTVRMVGRVGRDDNGHRLRADLAASGVDVEGVVVDPMEPTGMALILVDEAGENLIAVSPGANGAVDHTDAERAVSGLGPSDVVICQLEVPLPAVHALATATRVAGARLVCNAAPAAPLDTHLLQGIDLLVLNETEAQVVLGGDVREPAAAAAAAARAGCAIVVTLGAQGAVYAELDGASGNCPAPVVDVVDTVGAGDAFVGALAARLVAGAGLAEAVAAGVAAGSLAVSQAGA
jgi:ribokinase